MSLKDKLKGKPIKAVRKEPLWQGPCSDGSNGGITFSMLTRFLSCRERFRIAYIVGLKSGDRFNHRIEYGNMWHILEEEYAGNPMWQRSTALADYCNQLMRKHPLAQEQIGHWYNVCKTQFPIYVEYWSQHDDVKDRTPLLQEQVFDVPYTLPSGRAVRLRGKWDSVDLIGKGRGAQIFLQENKTKGDVDEEELRQQLTGDLQCMMYAVTLDEGLHNDEYLSSNFAKYGTITGVRYNVVRRPLSGGKGTIVQKKGSKNVPAETATEYYARLGGIIKEDPGHFFMRWKTEITPADIARFRRETLDPILEQLCDWYEWISDDRQRDPFDFTGRTDTKVPIPYPSLHWRHPFGAANSVDLYGASDLDAFMNSGDRAGLVERSTLFEELK